MTLRFPKGRAHGDGKQTGLYVSGASYDYTFSYDAMGRFEKILSGGSIAFQYYYDAASNETERHRFNGPTDVGQFYVRDSLNRMSRLDVKRDTTPLSAEVYTYDRMSRLTVANRWPENKQDLFGYYWDGEMYWAQYGVTGPAMPGEGGDPDQDMPDTTDPWVGWQGGPEAEGPPPPPYQGEPSPPPGVEEPAVPMDRWVSYFLDNAGNRTHLVDTGVHKAYTPNNLNQYTQAESLGVSNGGEHEVSSFQNVAYTYRNDERLIGVTGGGNNYFLAYDALGRCVKRTLNGVTTYYIYDGEKPVLEYNSGGALVGRNLYGKGIDEVLHRAYGAQSYYFQQDRNGNVTHLTDISGAIVEQYKYDAFGAVTVYDGSGTLRPNGTAYNNRFLFTGREYAATYAGIYVPAFNFYEYRARAYNPTLGRFMSEDPIGFVRGIRLGTASNDWSFSGHPDEAEYNLYRYCGNDPLDFTDPMGTDAIANGDDTYHYVWTGDVKNSYQSLIGGFVVGASGRGLQCAGAAQVLAGTWKADGLHEVPSARNGAWKQGAPLTKNTPNGTLVARGWENGVYPNKGLHKYDQKDLAAGTQVSNHTGIKVGWDDKAKQALILDQHNSENGSLQINKVDPKRGNWSVVNSAAPYEKGASSADIKLPPPPEASP